MSRSDPPSGDAALLVGLTAVVSAMIGFAALMYGLMQPTVLPNAAFDVAGQEKRAPIILRSTPQAHSPDVELSAIALAARENEIQGLRPIALAKAEPAASFAQAAVNPTAKAAKPKRVAARAPRRDAGAYYASNWWGGGQSFGGFGGWYR
jgi:hypothetical protein